MPVSHDTAAAASGGQQGSQGRADRPPEVMPPGIEVSPGDVGSGGTLQHTTGQQDCLNIASVCNTAHATGTSLPRVLTHTERRSASKDVHAALQVEVKLRLPGAEAHQKLEQLLAPERVATHQQVCVFVVA